MFDKTLYDLYKEMYACLHNKWQCKTLADLRPKGEKIVTHNTTKMTAADIQQYYTEIGKKVV